MQMSGTVVQGINVYKGTWNGTNDIAWTVRSTITPAFDLSYDGVAKIGEYNIAFDPTGQIGYVAIITDIIGGPAVSSFYPVFYRTTDGGNTWSAPIIVDLAQFSCISGNIVAGRPVCTGFDADLTVDVNGDPHLFTTICNGNNAYAIFLVEWHHMFDITSHNGVWNAIDVAESKGDAAYMALLRILLR